MTCDMGLQLGVSDCVLLRESPTCRGDGVAAKATIFWRWISIEVFLRAGEF